ncbi:MAG: hypothetical protein NC328_02900 [Muribaculum sp.]|nr:hypothetical protein [Muribaculum sp.]
METNERLESLQSQVDTMQGDISQILAFVKTESAKKKKEVKIPQPPPPRIKVTKDEAARILLISPRQVQRVRNKYKLKWTMIGRDSYYYLDTLVEAIKLFELPWDPAEFERCKKRITKIPEL